MQSQLINEIKLITAVANSVASVALPTTNLWKYQIKTSLAKYYLYMYIYTYIYSESKYLIRTGDVQFMYIIYSQIMMLVSWRGHREVHLVFSRIYVLAQHLLFKQRRILYPGAFSMLVSLSFMQRSTFIPLSSFCLSFPLYLSHLFPSIHL